MSAEESRIHVVSVLVANQAGVLSRVVGLISRRGFNIESLSVGPTEDPTRSRISIIVDADKQSFEQVTKQLNKLVCVYKIQDLTNEANAVEAAVDSVLNAGYRTADIAKPSEETVACTHMGDLIAAEIG